MSFKFIHAADIHLDSPLKGLERYEGAPVDEIRGASRHALKNLVTLAIDEEVAFVLLAGDIYDRDWKDFNTGLFFVQQMLRLKEAGIPVVAIHGNHDAANRMTKSLDLRESVRVLSPKRVDLLEFEEHGVVIHGRSFAKEAEYENLAADFPAASDRSFHIGLLHTSLTGGEGHDPYAPCTPQELRDKGYNYWALGHIHHRDDVSYRDPPIVFPGNLQGRTIRECGAKGCILVTVDDRQAITTEFKACDVFRWEMCPVAADNARHPADILDIFSTKLSALSFEHGEMPLGVRIRVSGQCAAHRLLLSDQERWRNELRITAHQLGRSSVWIEKVLFCTSVEQDQGEPLEFEGPLAELSKQVAEICASEAELHNVGGEFAALCAKLPPELRVGEDCLRHDNLAQLREFLTQAESMLNSHLTSREDAP